MDTVAADEHFIRKTFSLAQKGAGKVSPNPVVGAVIVKNGIIIGEGYHQQFGRVHAEYLAIESAKEPVSDATLYCNLEPCCHFNKKTPPCAQRIIKEKIKRVVISNLDPNPQVNGKGVELLRKSGIEVKTGILEKEGWFLNRFFMTFMRHKRPYVTLKIAQSLDGKINYFQQKQIWISSKKSRILVHKWRSEFDAVLVGSGTVLSDNPQLTVRYVQGRNPWRIILDGRLRTGEGYNLLKLPDCERNIFFVTADSDKEKVKRLRDLGNKVIKVRPDKFGHPHLKSVLEELAGMQIISLLVEGGQKIFSSFILNNMVDELKIFIAVKIFGKGDSWFSGTKKSDAKLEVINFEQVGSDILVTIVVHG